MNIFHLTQEDEVVTNTEILTELIASLANAALTRHHRMCASRGASQTASLDDAFTGDKAWAKLSLESFARRHPIHLCNEAPTPTPAAGALPTPSR